MKRNCVYVVICAILQLSAAFVTTNNKSYRETFLAVASMPSTQNAMGRRSIILSPLLLVPLPVFAKCTDIETCREIGERKVEQDLVDNPRIKLESGGMYKVQQPGTGEQTVGEDSKLDLIFSVSTLSGGYLYSRGFGYEKVDIGSGQMVKDSGLDSIRVHIGERNVPIGIEDALIGMKRGERRRVELPPRVGFATSNWQPEPLTKRGRAGMQGYRRMLEGTAGTPAFPASTIWDIEVLRIK